MAGLTHSPWGPSSLPRIKLCPGSVNAIAAARRKGDIPEVEPPKEYNIQGQKEHDACYAICSATPARKARVTADAYQNLLGNDSEAIARVSFAVETAEEIIHQARDWVIDDDEIVVLFEDRRGADPKDFFLTYGDQEHIDALPEESVSGTADLAIIDKENLGVHVVDYKFGYVEVPIEENIQFMAYALGVAGKWFTRKNPPKKITITAIQPQAYEKVKSASYTWEELIEFAREGYVPVIAASLEDDAPLVPSEAACMFCPLDGHCAGQKRYAQEAFAAAPTEKVPSLSDEELGEVANSVALIKKWVKAVEDACYSRQMAGRHVPGRKLVKRVKHKKWIDEDKTLKFLAARGLKKETREVTKPVSPSQAEKLLQGVSMSKRAWTSFNALWDKPDGGLKSVPVDAPGKEVTIEQEVKNQFENTPDDTPDNDFDIDDII